MRCEVITSSDMFDYAQDILQAMIAAAPIEVRVRASYQGDCDLMMTYGIGHAVRRPWFFKHVETGRYAIAWDIGYWHRRGKGRAMRVTINADHPQLWLVDAEEPPERFDSYGFKLRDDYNPNGPIVLVGMGPKANTVLHQKTATWEREALKRIRQIYPSKEVIYRPKKLNDTTELPDTTRMSGMPIEVVLEGASLVVCRHSNVAVDACFAGIPVVCEDGAAAALYDNDMGNPVMPTPEQRLRFLRNLAWWQWKPEEAAEAWEFLLTTIKGK